MARASYSYAQSLCIKKAGLALQKTASLWPGCRIGIAMSGGEDSFTLLKVMKIRQGIVPFRFEIMALHINPGYDARSHNGLVQWLAAEGLSSHVELRDFGPLAHAPEHKSPCFLCARQRRKRLFELCAFYRLTHLALGHNADDLLATFMLNFCRNGRVAGMSLNEPFFRGALRVIRPLLLVEKKYIHQASRQWRLPVWKNACPSAGHTARTGMDGIVCGINAEIAGARRSMLNAVARWQLAANTARGE